MSHTIDADKSSFTDDFSDPGPFNSIPSLTIIDEEDKIVEEYLEHYMPGEFPVSLSYNLLNVTTEDVNQFFAIHTLKQMSIFEKDHDVIESDKETKEDSDD